MDGVDRLLGGKVAAFDMRVPDRVYLRVPGHAEAVAAEAKAAAVAKATKAAGADGPARNPSHADSMAHSGPAAAHD
jgi:cell division protein FtsQ